MAQPSTLTVTGVGSSNVYMANYHCTPISIAFGTVVTGSPTYSIQHTYDGSTWYNKSDATNLGGNQDGFYAFPVRAIRITITSGTGTVVGTVIQAGIR